MNRILSDFLNPEKVSPQKSQNIKRSRPTLEEWKAAHPVDARLALIRAAHVFTGAQGQVVVARTSQAVRSNSTGAQVVFHSERFSSTKEKPSVAGVLSALEGRQAA